MFLSFEIRTITPSVREVTIETESTRINLGLLNEEERGILAKQLRETADDLTN